MYDHEIQLSCSKGRLFELMELLDAGQHFTVLTEAGSVFFRRPAWLPGYFVPHSALGCWAAGSVADPVTDPANWEIRFVETARPGIAVRSLARLLRSLDE